MSARFRSAFVWIVHLHFWMAAVATNLTPKKALRFLFIGDSYTYFNMMPTVFEKLCAAVGIRIVHNVVALGGAGLSDFAEGSKFPRLHKQAVSMLSHPHGWDYVVLQDESITAGGGALWWYYLQAFEMKQRSMEALRSFYAPWLRRLNATAVLYATWGRRDGFPPNSMPDYPQPPGFATFSSMTTLIAEGVRSYAAILAPEVPVFIAPCGRAFQFVHDAVVEARGEPFHDDTSRFACLFHHKLNATNCAMDVHGKTGHPSLMGSYMNACVMLATIFNRSPKGISWAPAGLSTAERLDAQHFASVATFAYGGGPVTATTTAANLSSSSSSSNSHSINDTPKIRNPVFQHLRQRGVVRILFIGNALTSTNNLPAMFEKICAAAGIHLVQKLLSGDGFTLFDWADQSKKLGRQAASLLHPSHSWDYVVLQDHGLVPGGGGASLLRSHLASGEAKRLSIEALRSFFAPRLRMMSATAVLFTPWGHPNGVPLSVIRKYSMPSGYSNFSSMTELSAKGVHSYAAALAPEVPAFIAPCGRAFELVHNAVVEAPGEPLSNKTSHFACLYQHNTSSPTCAYDQQGLDGNPSILGSYMTACVFFATIFKRSPTDISWTPSGLNKAEISAAQHFALEASATYGGGPETTTTTTFNAMSAGIDATHTVPWWPSFWPPSKMLSISFVLCNVDYHKLISRPSLCGGVSEELRSAIAYEVNNSTESVLVKNVSVELSPGSVTVAAAVKVGSRRMLGMQSQYPLSLSADELGSRLTERMVSVTGLDSVMTGPIEVTNVTISPTNSMAINKLNTWFPGLFGSDLLYTLAALICLFIPPAYCCILKRRPGDPSVGGYTQAPSDAEEQDPSVGGYTQAPSDAEEQICEEPFKTEETGTVSTGTCSTTLSTDPLLRELLK